MFLLIGHSANARADVRLALHSSLCCQKILILLLTMSVSKQFESGNARRTFSAPLNLPSHPIYHVTGSVLNQPATCDPAKSFR